MDKSHLLIKLGCILLTLPLVAQARFNGFGREIDTYIKESANRYQVSETMLRGLVKMEDGWYGKISPTGPIGVGQFTMGTWNFLANTVEGYRIGMRPVTAKNRNTRFDPRHNKYINTLATALYARWHIEQFAERGIKPTDENLYLAHNIGLDGLHRAILGRSTAEDIRNMRRNGMKRGMSVKQFIAYQTGRYNSHKSIANFVLKTGKQTEIVWIKPQTHKKRPSTTETESSLSTGQSAVKNAMIWIEPSDNNVLWIDNTVKM
ncbi:hypothetical protein BKG93_06040 [Rodentibacter ratti]|uniref:Lytic murein transglycosylase n=2 Tax=Rodentibacter TaxID=1960084 RepID=A0A1V3L4S7_9PAST|nr:MULTISPECIES: hypothetical protein [Rodentibacter]OOF79661.1 hypothetical protein BKG96_01285 [Rodentibacter heylii]OOF84811.1 hypothetical protein BKG93_06040 [Rodentibacter ratti]